MDGSFLTILSRWGLLLTRCSTLQFFLCPSPGCFSFYQPISSSSFSSPLHDVFFLKTWPKKSYLFLKKLFPSVYHRKEKDKTTNQYCQYDSQTLTMFTSSLYLATLISSIVAATVMRKFVQKLSMLFSGLLFCADAIINGIAETV
ncbi:hypothetical protein ACFXTN_023273 [Malus domestica]